MLLLGRRSECERVDTAVAAARNGLSSVLVVRGEPGIGKTALLDYAVESAAEMQLARLTGVEAEAGLGYAGLHRLLAPFLSLRRRLPAPQRCALESALGLSDDPANPLLLGLATLTLLTEVTAARGPMLCVVDDAHWLDRESLEAIGFAARRLHSEGFALLMAVREPAERRLPLDGLPTVSLPGLDPHSAARLLALRVGTLSREVTGRVMAETGGNPLAIVELAGEFTAGQLTRRAQLPQPLPLSQRVESRFVNQVMPMPPATQTLMLTAAAESAGDAEVVRAACRILGVPPDAVRPAEDAGLLTMQPRVAFRHPLVRSAIYGAAPAAERRRVHDALATVLGKARDPDRRAWHLAAASTGPDEGVAAELELSAQRARRRGAHAAVAGLLARAAELTPDAHRRAQRYLAAATMACVVGTARQVRAYLDLAEPGLETYLQRAEADRLRAMILRQVGRPSRAAPLIVSAAKGFEPFDIRQARDTWLEALATVMSGHPINQVSLVEIARAALAAPKPEHVTLSDLLVDGLASRFALGYPASAPIFRRVLDRAAEEPVHVGFLHYWAAYAECAAKDLLDDEARRRVLTHFTRQSRRHGDIVGLLTCLIKLGQAEICAGHFAAAEACNAELRDLVAAIGARASRWGFFEVELRAWRGEAVSVRDAIAALEGATEERLLGEEGIVAHRAWTILELSLGNYQEALAPARWMYQADPVVTATHLLPDLIEAGVRGGDRDAAAAALERLSDRAQIAGTRWAAGLLARSRALLAGDDAAAQLYETAIDQLAGTNVRTDLARAHLLYGEWLRRQKRRAEARVQLRIAHDAFDSMGAVAFAERARLELAATGETAIRRQQEGAAALTPREFQIASLVTAGATNDEIASQLFISSKTVAYHLSKIFRKLEVTSRRQLRNMLAQRSEASLTAPPGRRTRRPRQCPG